MSGILSKEKSMSPSALKKWAPLIAIVCLMLLAWALGLHHAVSLENFKAHKSEIREYTLQNPALSVAAFSALYIISVALSLPIASLLTFIGGFLFGQWLGTLYVVVSATIGAILIFLTARSSLGESLRRKAGPLYEKVQKDMNENAFSYLLGLRLMPVFPFFVINILPALFNVRLKTYIAATFLGILPGSFVYVNVGRALGEADNLRDLVSGSVLLAFTLLGVFALIPVAYKKISLRKKKLQIMLFAVAFSCVATVSHAIEEEKSYELFLSSYGALLSAYVQPAAKAGIQYQGVDYNGWAQNKNHHIALNLLLQTNPETMTTSSEKMSFWINAYNLLTIDILVRTNERESIKNLGSVFSSPWKTYKWKIGGKEYALDDIEHKILRPMRDPRIHFAINCASVSCPDLRPEPYSANTLDAQLDDQVNKTLLNEGKGLKISRDGKTVYLTKIADWYKDDFDKGDITGWLRKHTKLIPGGKPNIKYFAYDWSINSSN